MMGKTHLTIGMATSLIVMNPINLQECIGAIIGGAIGGVVADIDILDNDYKQDALIGQVFAVSISGISMLIDYVLKLGICQNMINRNFILIVMGVMMYLILVVRGYNSKHRTFTHSFLSMFLFSTAVYLICPLITLSYFTGYCSHLVLDVLNKKKVPLLYPKGKGFCFGFFYAGKTANKVFMVIGTIISVFIISNAVFLYLF